VDGPLAVTILSTGRSTRLAIVGVPVGIANGELIFAGSDGALKAAPFDARARRVTGGERDIVAELRRDDPTGSTAVALSVNGTLAYATGSEVLQAVVVDLQGAARPLPIPPGRLVHLRYAPDGRRVAAEVNRGGRSDVFIYDVASGAERRVTDDGPSNVRPAWSPDGTRILYRTNREGQNGTIWWQPADGSGVAEQLTASPGKTIWEGEMTPDGQHVVYRTGLVPGDIVYRRLSGDTAEKGIATSRFNEIAPRLSTDGRWVAYASDESGGRTQVYVRPFPGPGAQVPVSVSGGTNPVWSRDDRKIFFVNGRQLVAASVATSPSFSVTARDVLFEGNYNTGFRHAGYDVAPDGKSFVMLRFVEDNSEQIVVIHNWAADQRAGAKAASRQ
jgi:Tol biopolymer transport system component